MFGTLVGVVATVLLALGLALGTVGLYGLLRKPDIFHQLHAGGLVTGPAVLLVLLASLGTGNARIITSAVLVILFVLITSPLSGHAIAQAAHRRNTSNQPPDQTRDGAPDDQRPTDSAD